MCRLSRLGGRSKLIFSGLHVGWEFWSQKLTALMPQHSSFNKLIYLILLECLFEIQSSALITIL